MATSTLRDLEKDDTLLKLIRRKEFFGPDPKLKRYSKSKLKDYVEFCCEQQHLIEAYSLTLQHVEDLIFYAVGPDKYLRNIDVSKIVATLYSSEAISDDLYKQFDAVKTARNYLAHRMIRDPEARKRIAKTDLSGHSENLIKLIDLAEEFFLNWVKKFPGRFLLLAGKKLKENHRVRMDLLGHIIGGKVSEEVKTEMPKKGLTEKEWKSQFEEKFKERFKQRFAEVFGVKLPAEEA